MKNAEEWSSEIIDYELTHYDGSYTKLIKQIQLDAMKEGMRRAAGVRATYSDSSQTLIEATDILTASEQLTKKDL